MEKREKTKIGLFLLFGIMIFSVIPLISPAYISSNSRYTQPGMSSYSYLAGQGIDIYPQLDPEKCGAGQDFLIQISPLGCSPSVVRSDLLEEQNVAVFCPLMATKLNPLIDVEAINNINFRDYPSGVSGIGFHPAQSALSTSYRTMLNSPVLENIGYAVIVLKKQKNESSMPDYVEGTVTANIKYDIQNAFGTGRSVYYLPVLEDGEWEENYQQYAFWKGKGYLRADAVGLNDARISIYRDQDTVLSVKNIQKGETTPETVYIPGYYCLAGVQLRLDGLESYDTFAKISIDGEYYELKDGERFLDNKCEVRDLQKQGLNEKVKIYCDVDEGQRNFELNIIPQITLKVNGVEKSYTIGDKIATSDEANKDIYLGAAYTYHDSGKLDDLRLYLIKAPTHEERLSDGDINSVYGLSKNLEPTSTGFIPRDVLFTALKTYLGAGKLLYNWLIEGETFAYMEYGASSKLWGSEISVMGFSQPSDMGINEDFQKNFDKAETDYLEVVEDYSGEKIQGTEETYAKKDLIELIKMSWATEQGKTMLEYCDLLETKYPDSIAEVAEYCSNPLKISSSEISTQDVVVDGEVRLFSFEGIKEPGFEEYGATVSVSGAGEGYNGEKKLKKNEIIYVSEDEFFQLTKVEEDYIEIRTEVKVPALRDNPKTVKIELNDYSVLADKYNIHLDDINLKKVAKVSLLPNIKYSETTTNFTFKIGIEKRGIQLTPEEIKSKIEKIDDQLSKWEDISSKLANTVKTMKTACLGTGAFLTLTNFLADSKGTALARQRVMRSNGGWYDYCVKEVESKTYSSIDACLLDKADDIDKDVDTMTSIINSQNEKIKDMQTYVDAPLGGKVVNEEKFVGDYSRIVAGKIPSNLEGINTSIIKGSLTVDGWQNGNFYKDDLRDIELYSDVLNSNSASPELKEIARRELTTTLTRVQGNSEQDFQLNTLSTKWNTKGFSNLKADAYGSKDSNVIPYEGDVAPAGNSLNLEAGTPVQLITYNNKEYLLSLNAISSDSYAIDSIYDSNGVKVENPEIRSSFSKLQSFDKNTYKNPYSNAEVKYFETGEYKGWPSIVPFDTQNGWYVAVRQTLPGLGNIRAYDESGRVASFWIGNVGENQRQQFNEQSSDDIIMQFNPGTGEIYGTFPGLDESDTRKLVQDAVNAVSDAQRAYKSGVKNVRINGQSITVGTPSINVPEVQCQDFMSPTDCNLLFNICDPVICPSSRCNLGGNYYVDDVIQTGIIGGIALCLPNYREGIAIPICLSGINAGVENLLSVAHSYRDCLQESLDTGEQVGICDYINSIYLCEFFWREATPFLRAGIPSLLSWISGQGARGGGEYMALTSAYNNAVSSVDYFVDYYAENSFSAFKTRSTEEVGSEVCKNSLSVKYPTSADLIDALTEPDSPVQYTGWFEEIPFTTATSPPISQYKIFYHIYAGKDIGHYYRVYLKSPTGFSLYQESPSVIIAQGYVGVGESATETKDLTASSGYKELCINIDGQDDCGFAEVSTSFASDYISDKYIEEQTTQEVTSESECVSGSPSWYGLLNANVEEGVSEALNPELYNKGIVRVCSSANPGLGTDENRWTKVGYCTDKNTGCWLDTQSVKDAVSIKSIEEGILDETTENYLDALRQEGGYFTEEEANRKIIDLREKVGYSMERGVGTTNSDELIQAIIEINSAYEKVLLSNEKVQLIDLRARAYNKLARNEARADFIKRVVLATEPEKSPATSGETVPKEGASFEETGGTFSEVYIQRYEKYKSIFEKYAKNSPSELDETEFKALLVAIATKETSLGYGNRCGKSGNDPCENWLMGYNSGGEYNSQYNGAENQVKYAADTLQRAFDKQNSLYSKCNEETPRSINHIKCILSVYGPSSQEDYKEIVYSYFLLWKGYFETGEFPKEANNIEVIQEETLSAADLSEEGFSSSELEVINTATSCGDCGNGGTNVCDKKECLAVGIKTGLNCVYRPTLNILPAFSFGIRKGECNEDQLSPISEIYIERYEQVTHEGYFERYAKQNLPSGFSEDEFKALLVAIAQKESSLGYMPCKQITPGVDISNSEITPTVRISTNCTVKEDNNLMGYGSYNYVRDVEGAQKQIELASLQLKNAFEGTDENFKDCNSFSNFNLKLKCILRIYSVSKSNSQIGNAWANDVLEYSGNWEYYFEEGEFLNGVGSNTKSEDSSGASLSESGIEKNADLIEKVELKQIVKWGRDKVLDYVELPPKDTTVLRIYRNTKDISENPLKSLSYNLVLKDNNGKELINIDRNSGGVDFIFVLKDGDFNLLSGASLRDVYSYEITASRGNDFEKVTGPVYIGTRDSGVSGSFANVYSISVSQFDKKGYSPVFLDDIQIPCLYLVNINHENFKSSGIDIKNPSEFVLYSSEYNSVEKNGLCTDSSDFEENFMCSGAYDTIGEIHTDSTSTSGAGIMFYSGSSGKINDYSAYCDGSSSLNEVIEDLDNLSVTLSFEFS